MCDTDEGLKWDIVITLRCAWEVHIAYKHTWDGDINPRLTWEGNIDAKLTWLGEGGREGFTCIFMWERDMDAACAWESSMDVFTHIHDHPRLSPTIHLLHESSTYEVSTYCNHSGILPSLHL